MARTTEEIYRELIAQAQGQGSQTPKTNDNILQYASNYNPDAQTGSNAYGASEDYYRELMNQGRAAQERANSYLSQYDNRGPFRYDANNDPVYQSLRDQYVHQGKRAMADTMGQAAGLTGGYASTYGQSVGNQAYNEYLTKLSAQIPGLAANARAAYDAEGDRLLNRYNLELNAAGTAYNQARDALGDLRYEREYADNQARQQWEQQQQEIQNAMSRWNQLGYADESIAATLGVEVGASTQSAAYQQWQQQQAEQQAAWDREYQQWQQQQAEQQSALDREYQQWQMGRANQGDAYNHAMTLIQLGHMPNTDTLTAAGISAEDAQWLVEYYSQLLANQNSGGGSGGGNGRYYYNGGQDDGDTNGGPEDNEANYAYYQIKTALGIALQTNNIDYVTQALNDYSGYLTPEMRNEIEALLDKYFPGKPKQNNQGGQNHSRIRNGVSEMTQ